MMLPAFNKEDLKKRLTKLDNRRQLAFAITCCERLLPNYAVFESEAGWGDLAPLRNALDGIWAYLTDQGPSSQEIKNLAACCDAVTPVSEDFGSIYADLAQDVCLAVSNLLSYLIESDIKKILSAAAYATDGVDLYVQETENLTPNDPELKQRILTHRLMQRELAQQEKDLQAIESVPSLSQDFLAQLKASWNNNGRSNLDLP